MPNRSHIIPRSRKVHSQGTFGERLAKLFFEQLQWQMIRLQPPTRVVRINGEIRTIQQKSSGEGDYVGYIKPKAGDISLPVFVAAEVKEAQRPRMKCSRLTTAQRDWMNSLPECSRTVVVVWNDNMVELFEYKPRGSYVYGRGAVKRYYG